MKRAVMLAGLLLLTGCGSKAESESSAPAEPVQTGMAVYADTVDPDYAAVIEKYFKAVEADDYAAYCETLYKPYIEAAEAFLQQKEGSLEKSFHEMHAQFDEDGYESWTFTDLSLTYYSEDQKDAEDFLNVYVTSGMIDEKTAKKAKKDAKEMRDIKFTLSALYDGDQEPVTVVQGKELLVLKTGDGCFLFG